MNAGTEGGPPEPDLLAAELVLGLLDGDERAEAARHFAEDPGFAAAVAEWRERFAPLLDSVTPVTPDPALWARIAAALPRATARGAEVVDLSRRLARWRFASAGMTALAASLAVFLLVRPDAPRPVPANAPAPAPVAPPLVAALSPADAAPALAVSYDPTNGALLVTPTDAPGAERSLELWLVPGQGAPRSLGLLSPTGPSRVAIPAELRGALGGGASLAVSREPAGGSLSGLPTGPIVAVGKLQAI